MVFWCWAKPSRDEQKSCIIKSGAFNYDLKYQGATAQDAASLKEDENLVKDGFSINHARVLIGSGANTYEKGKKALESWRHFGLNWAFVDPKTPVQTGAKFCVCVKEILPWMMMPLQVVYVKESRKAGHGNANANANANGNSMASFSFGSGTLQGHLLTGEERFSVELDDKGQVCDIEKPRNFFIESRTERCYRLTRGTEDHHEVETTEMANINISVGRVTN